MCEIDYNCDDTLNSGKVIFEMSCSIFSGQ